MSPASTSAYGSAAGARPQSGSRAAADSLSWILPLLGHHRPPSSLTLYRDSPPGEKRERKKGRGD